MLRRLRQRGFTLIEMALVVVVLGVLMAMGTTFLTRGLEGKRLSEARGSLDMIENALTRFVATTGRLPCPHVIGTGTPGVESRTGNTCNNNQANGVVPWVTLGLSEAQALDAWKVRFTYRVDEALVNTTARPMDFTDCDPAADADQGTACDPNTAVRPLDVVEGLGLLVRNEAGQAVADPGAATPTGAAYVLISHGRNRVGGMGFGDTVQGGTASAAEQRNFVDLALDTTNGLRLSPQSGTFDDEVRAPTILTVATRAGLGPRSRYGGDDASPDSGPYSVDGNPNDFVSTDSTQSAIRGANGGAPAVGSPNSINFGSNASTLEDGDTLNNVAGNSRICNWLDQKLNFTNHRLKTFFRFKLTQQTANSSTGLGDGFTFAIISHTLTVSATGPCGGYGEFLAYGPRNGANITPPKMAIEVDTYRNNPAQNDPDGNHVAVLRKEAGDAATDDVRHSVDNTGTGSDTVTTNPACSGTSFQSSTNGSNTPTASGALAGGCTMPSGTSTRNWLEDGNFHTMRVEINRRCNSDCSACSVSDGTFNGSPATYGYAQVRAWIDAPESGADDVNPDILKKSDADRPTWAELDAVTPRTLNWCGEDPGGTRFDQVRVGFTMSSGGAQSSLQITDFVVMSEVE